MIGPHVHFLDLALEITAIPILAAAAYLALLALAAGWRAPLAGARWHRFDVIIPAHDEGGGIEATVRSVLAVDYPTDLYRVLVVADNCSDSTADRARAAGARLLERHDDTRRGKGYALELAYRASCTEGFADAVVVIDADSVASGNLLTAFSAHLEQGQEAMQAEYGIRNPNASWRTRLMVVAFALFHTTRSRARETLGLSCGLRGNGMCFSTALLRRVAPSAFSVVEDIEYGLALGRAGVRVAHVGEAAVLGDMPATGRDASSQRARWEGGRWRLARQHVPSLLREAIARRDIVLLDLAADLLVPPLTTLTALAAGGGALALVAYLAGAASLTPLILWSLATLCLIVYVTRALIVTEMGWSAVGALMWVPVYAIWKLVVLTRPSTRPVSWVRTSRSHDIPKNT